MKTGIGSLTWIYCPYVSFEVDVHELNPVFGKKRITVGGRLGLAVPVVVISIDSLSPFSTNVWI